MPQAAPKRGENSVGAALCGRPGRGACSGPTAPPTQGGHIGPPLHAPSLFSEQRGLKKPIFDRLSPSSPGGRGSLWGRLPSESWAHLLPGCGNLIPGGGTFPNKY